MQSEKCEKQERHPMNQEKKYDVFISHANKDKSDYVDELYLTLRKLGINIFYVCSKHNQL